MLTLDDVPGITVGIIKGGEFNSRIITASSDDKIDGCTEIKLKKGVLEPIPSFEERQVTYIAGPSGSGKSHYASMYIKHFLSVNPKAYFYLFSRSDEDPVLDVLKPCRVKIDNNLVDNPIDIANDFYKEGGIILFDDVNTIQDDKIKKAVDKIIMDILEVGRKLNIYIVMTNHLVIPNEKKIARTIMNEMQTMTVFPKSGSSQQIRYALKTYYGLDKNQIDKILKIKSRWVTIYKSYPQLVLYDKGIYIL